MKQNKATVFFIALFVLFLTVGGTHANAMGFGRNNSDMISSLAKKLGIAEDKLKSAFDSMRTDRQKEMQKAFEERLTQAVKDKKITEAQKNLILQKHAELQKTREADWNARQQKRTELEAWAEKNGIDPSYLFGGFGKGGMMRGW
jgi:predicted esterase